ncbi:MAG: hypothetical protein L0207_00495 [Chlamydiae bacterium]|nr:hypothetical protein [Chlamydiota bacterium]
MEKFWEIISGAPWWIYLIFIYLVIIGIQSMKPRTISIKRVVLLPLLFVAWSFYGLYEKVLLGFSSLIFPWIIFLALGAYLGVKEVYFWHFHKDHQKGTITIPGNYSTLVLILLIFILKFSWGYIYAARTEIPYWIYLSDIITSSLVTGFFVGRAAFFFKSYQKK